MINNKNIQALIATALRKIGNDKCLEKAILLEQNSAFSNTLQLRNLELNSINVLPLLTCLKEIGERDPKFIRSISFSYNTHLGDTGAIALAKHLPKSIREIGLVNCGIRDDGGIEILNWMKENTQLQMICMEENDFSEKLKLEMEKFKRTHPQVLVVF